MLGELGMISLTCRVSSWKFAISDITIDSPNFGNTTCIKMQLDIIRIMAKVWSISDPTRSILLFWQHLQQQRIQQGQHTNQQQTNQKTKRTMDNLSWILLCSKCQWQVKITVRSPTVNGIILRKILVVMVTLVAGWGGPPKLNSKRLQSKTKDIRSPHKNVDII